MPTVPSPLVSRFLDSVPTAFLARVPVIIHHAYAAALKFSTKFDKPEAHDIRRLVQRVYVEASLRATALEHGLRAAARKNSAQNCYHTFVQAPPFILTQSYVPSPETFVRRALFRDGYAQDSQGDFFLQEDPPPDIERIYGIVLHGPHPKEEDKPGFICTRFPMRGVRAYVPGTADLLRLFPVGRPQAPEVPQEEIEETLEIEIADFLRRKEQNGG